MAFAITEGTLAGARPRTVDGSATFGIDRLAGITSVFGRTLAYDAIYRSQPHVRTVVDYLARQVASIKLGLYERVDTDHREEVDDGQPAAFYRRPNPQRSRFAFYRDVVSDLLVYDALVAVKAILPSGRPVAVRIPPKYVVPTGKNWLEPEGFAVIATAGKAIELRPDQVIYVHGYSPDDPRLGVPPIETLRVILAEDEAAAEYRANVWRNGARMSGYVKRPVDAPDWSEPARERFLTELRALFTATGAEAGGTAIFEEGMEYEKLAATAVELDYAKARQLNRGEVCSVFHVDELLVGGKPEGGSSVTGEARRGMYADTLSPLLTFLAEELEVATFTDFDLGLDDGRYYLEHNLEAKLRGHFVDQAEVISRSVGGPWLTRDEARALFNRAPLPDGVGAEVITPLNVTVGGRANPADTAPGTPGLGQASAYIDDGDGNLRPVYPVKALPPAPAKADAPGGELDDVLRPWVDPTVKLLDRWAARARRTVVGRVRRGNTVAAAFDAGRWARELTADALALSVRQAKDVGGRQLEDLDVDDAYNVDGAAAWLEGAADVFGKGVTDALLEDLKAAYAGAKAKADDDVDVETPPADLVDEAFVTFAAGRLLVEAATRVATIGNFSRYDAAQQAGAGSKTWRTSSANPRSSHAALNGATVAIGDTFSNGALWPGDPILPAEERANCACRVTFDLN